MKPFEAVGRLRALPGLVLLDSSQEGCATGRYSYVTADPFLTVRSHGCTVEIRDQVGLRVLDANPWDVLEELLGRYTREPAPGLPPFQGGVAGYFGYDLGRHLERLPVRAADDLGLPEMHVGFYDWALGYDQVERRGWLFSTGLPSGDPLAAGARLRQVEALLSDPGRVRADENPLHCVRYRPTGSALSAPRPFRSNMSRAAYVRAVERVKGYISAGDVYQVNLSQRLEAPWEGDGWALYCRLREVSPVPYGAYLSLGDVKLLSASPERFLRLDGRHVDTRPIKGTRPRGRTQDEDRALAAELLGSEKDRAENLMIVDLLRNDLGRVCEVGSVRVPRLFDIEPYSNVWQLVSTVTGELRAGLGPVDLLKASFPGGSVTGAPKIRAMEIIEELEPVRRGPYCGAIGYIGFSGAMDTSVVIRTLVLAGGRAYLQVGGGIVADSDPLGEYEESLVKARSGLEALGAWLEEA